jgi:hypothetical protein
MGTIRQTTAQSITVDYIVTEELDGETMAPEVIIDQTASNRTPFDTKAQIFKPDPVPKLGLIDPDLLVGGSIGARCIPFLTLDTAATGVAGAAVDIVGVRGGDSSDVFFQKQIRDLAGVTGPEFIDQGFNVPQGSDIKLDGFVAIPGSPICVRATILVPTSCVDIAAFQCPCPEEGCCAPILSPFPFADVSVQTSAGWNVYQVAAANSPFFFLVYNGLLDTSVHLLLTVDQVDAAEPPTAEAIKDPLFAPPGTVPDVGVSNVTPGTGAEPAIVDLQFDFSERELPGSFLVRISNPCGCSALFGIFIVID